MDLAVEFEFEANYRRIFEAGSAPYIEIGLKWNGCDQNFFGLVDSGAYHTLINRSWAEEAFAIDVEDMLPRTLTGGGGPFSAWGPYHFAFELDAQDAQGRVVKEKFDGPVYFAETVPKNFIILGRIPIFDRYVIAFHHRWEQMLFARA